MGVGAGVGLGDGEGHLELAGSRTAGSHRCFWASVPNWAMMVAQMAGDTTMTSSGQPAAASSSSTAASSAMPPPPPPYSSGTLTPRKPASATAFHSSSVRSSAWAFFT